MYCWRKKAWIWLAIIEAFESIVNVNSDRVRTGDLAKVELVRSQVAALQFRNAVRQAESKLRVANNRLQSLMGRRALSATFDVAGDLRRDTGLVTLEDVRTRALELRRICWRSIAIRRVPGGYTAADRAGQDRLHREHAVSPPFWNARGNSLGFSSARRSGIQQEPGRDRTRSPRAAADRGEDPGVQNEIGVEVQNAYQQYATAKDLLESFEKIC